MKTPEDEAFDELSTRQGDWGSGFQTKPWNEDEWRRNNWRCGHGWLRGEQCESCNAPQPPSEWAGIKAILDEYGLQAIDFVADFKATLAQPAQEPVAFAGIEMWVGGARITKHLTQTELHYARDPWMLMQYSAEFCLAKLMEKNNGT